MRLRPLLVLAATATLLLANSGTESLTPEGRAAFEKGNCNLCHTVPGIAEASRDESCRDCHLWIRATSADPSRRAKAMQYFPYWERYERNVASYLTVPSLAASMARLDPAWVDGYLEDPHDLRPRLGTLLFREQVVQKLVDVHLVLPMSLRYLREVRQCPAIQLDTLLDQFPSNARDDLLAPGIEQAREANAPACCHTAEARRAFHHHCLRSGATGLNRRDMTCRSAADHKHIHFVGHFRLSSIRYGLSRHMRGRSNGQPRGCRADNGLLQKLATASVGIIRISH